MTCRNIMFYKDLLNNDKNTLELFYSINDILYKLKENAQPEKRTDDKNEYEYFKYKEKDVEEVARFYLTQAVLFNTQMPHTAINPTKEPRIMLTIRFNKALSI